MSTVPALSAKPLKIAVGSQKGGVSKTTTTLSLGACLAEDNSQPGRSVLLIDLDPQANLTMALGVNPGGLRRMIGDALLEQSSLLAISRESAVPRLDLVPANQGLLVLDKVLFGRPGFEYRLRQQLGGPIRQQYDVIILDCPPAFGTLTMNALTASDLLLIPVPCDYFSARSLQQFLELVDLVQHNTNPALRFRILITMFDKRNRISHIVQDQVRRKYGSLVFNTIISIDTKLRESPVIGQPITQYAPNSRSAQEYRALATELMQDEQTRSSSQAAA
ncbi:MAG: ParA family protein [Chloroflexi bacterium]|nr:ParA family protein [Chloroflexota bacterium]